MKIDAPSISAGVNVLVPVRDTTRTRDYLIEKKAASPFLLNFLECNQDPESIISNCMLAEILYVRGTTVDERTITELKACKLIVSGSVGLDNIDIRTASNCGIAVVNVPDLFTSEVAEHAISLILSSYRRLGQVDRMVREGRWIDGHNACAQIGPFAESTLGLVGFGRIARSVAMAVSHWGVNLIASDPHVPENEFSAIGVARVDLETLARESDIVSLHLPATVETGGLIDERFFRRMKKSAVLVNTGRGSTVVEAALVQALEKKEIRGAALDVFASEPLTIDHPLTDLENVILTPHVGSITSSFEPKRKLRVGEEIHRFLSGLRPVNCINWGEINHDKL